MVTYPQNLYGKIKIGKGGMLMAGERKKARKMEKRTLFVRIVAIVLVALIAGSALSVVFFL